MTGFLQILSNFICRKKVYHLQFDHEADDKWYYHCPNWPLSHHNLMMVFGADKLCAFLSEDDVTCKVIVIPSNKRLDKEGYAELEKSASRLTAGAFYNVHHLNGFTRNVWICPVTLTVLGHYPKYIYVKKEI